MARTFALLIAEAPARTEPELERKIEIYETMCFLPGEMERSRTAYMVEVPCMRMRALSASCCARCRTMPVPAACSRIAAMSSFIIHDLETTGLEPAWNVPLQAAFIHTDEARPLSEPSLRCALPAHIVPSPD